MDLSTALSAIKTLSVDDRLWLVGEIWNDIATQSEVGQLTESQQAEFKERLESHRADPSTALSWDQVKLEIQNRP